MDDEARFIASAPQLLYATMLYPDDANERQRVGIYLWLPILAKIQDGESMSVPKWMVALALEMPAASQIRARIHKRDHDGRLLGLMMARYMMLHKHDAKAASLNKVRALLEDELKDSEGPKSNQHLRDNVWRKMKSAAHLWLAYLVTMKDGKRAKSFDPFEPEGITPFLSVAQAAHNDLSPIVDGYSEDPWTIPSGVVLRRYEIAEISDISEAHAATLRNYRAPKDW